MSFSLIGDHDKVVVVQGWMHKELSEELFKEQTKFCYDDNLLKLRSWRVVARSYPTLEVEFSADGKSTIRVKMTCDDWDELPPSVELLDSSGAPLRPYPQGQGVFNNSAHPKTGKPFLCTPGVREYHQHTSHISDSWDNYKTRSGFDLGGLLTQIWNAWKVST